MPTYRRLIAVALASTLAASLPAAHALSDAPTDKTVSEYTSGLPVPSCVTKSFNSDGSIVVRNDCDNQESVKVVVAHGRDSACTLLESGESFTHQIKGYAWDWSDARLDGVYRC